MSVAELNHDLSSEDRAWLDALQAAIWRHHPATPSSYAFSSVERCLTALEFTHLDALIRVHELPCEPGSGLFGFGTSMAVYTHPPCHGLPAEAVLSLVAAHLPRPYFGAIDHRAAWEVFSKYTHTPRNRELLAYYDRPPVQDFEHYDY